MSIQYYPGYSQEIIERNLTTETIDSITQAYPAVVITSESNHYVAGMVVTFQIPKSFGMQELNKKIVQVTNVSGNDITINVDTTTFSPFAYPSPLPSAYTPPTMIPYSSGPYLPPLPLPFGNQISFEGVQYNGGSPGNFI